MSNDKTVSAARRLLGDFAPKLVDLTEGVLFGDLWERPQLSKRDRSLITCAALVSTGKTEQMEFHFPRALENGVTYEYDGVQPHWRAIYDDHNRVMVAICWNQDNGDAWEWADSPYYPEKMTGQAYRMGINYIIYAMSH